MTKLNKNEAQALLVKLERISFEEERNVYDDHGRAERFFKEHPGFVAELDDYEENAADEQFVRDNVALRPTDLVGVKVTRKTVNEKLADAKYELALRFTEGKGWFPAIVDMREGQDHFKLDLGNDFAKAAKMVKSIVTNNSGSEFSAKLPNLNPFC